MNSQDEKASTFAVLLQSVKLTVRYHLCLGARTNDRAADIKTIKDHLIQWRLINRLSKRRLSISTIVRDDHFPIIRSSLT